MGTGLEHDPDEVYAEYTDPRRDTWRTLVLPVLHNVPAAALAAAAGLHPRSVPAIRNGRRRPHPRTREALTRAAADYARERLREQGMALPADDLIACAEHLRSQSRPRPARGTGPFRIASSPWVG